jgi:dienelactone hydrolase
MRALILGSLMLAGASHASETGLVSFKSAGSLQRSAVTEPFALSGESITLTGELLLPDGAGPFPAVILVHGCEGNRYVEPTWGAFLRGAGYATFNIDSLEGRGLKEVCTQPTALTPVQRVADAYGALRYLSAHQKVDAKRVALMGFSHGGILAMYASTRWAKDNFAPDGRPAFRAFIPFYPYCNPVFPERDHVYAPVRIHTGAADDWTPAEPCAKLAAALKASGYDPGLRRRRSLVRPGEGFDLSSGGRQPRGLLCAAAHHPQSGRCLEHRQLRQERRPHRRQRHRGRAGAQERALATRGAAEVTAVSMTPLARRVHRSMHPTFVAATTAH